MNLGPHPSYIYISLKSLSLNDSFGPLLGTYDPLDLINGCNAFLSSIGALDSSSEQGGDPHKNETSWYWGTQSDLNFGISEALIFWLVEHGL